MRELIKEYYEAAAALERRSKELFLQMKRERNVFELHKLERRRQLLDAERYEIMRDINDMRESMGDYSEEYYEQAV